MEHPITPPPELVQKLRNEAPHGIRDAGVTRELCLIAAAYRAGADQQLKLDAEQIAHAYQAGADQELEACIEWFDNHVPRHPEWSWSANFRATRRPKPLSLKEQALEAAKRFYAKGHEGCTDAEVKDDFDTIRRALEALPND